MSTLILNEPAQIAIDDFQALEQRVLRTIELLQAERKLRAAAEEHASSLEDRLDQQAREFEQRSGQQASLLADEQAQLTLLHRERDSVRQRVERMLKQLDEIAG
jgi:hypothetical protein